MIRRRVSIIHVVPYLLQGLVQHPRLSACTSLRHVVCGGEELPPDLPVRFYENCRARLYNLYGPTEFTIDALFWPIPQLNEYTVIPVGKPITNVQAYILDEYMQPVPLGVPGELYLAGEGMARGYLKNPELTAERFVPNPFGTGPGERLYRTGDLVRYLADDGIVFMGRLDQQVKLRGSRIELGEIEVVLRSHPSVEQAIATLIQESPGDKYLAAYVVPKDEQSGDALELRSYMRTRLPEYMLPATFVFLDKFPLTDSGKINRNALPEPDRSSALYQRNYAPPTTPVARVVADVWASVLEVDRVGMTDNFFELGGHSLLAIRLTSRMQDAFQLDLPVRIVFEAQTMADYCEMMLDWSSDRERIEQIAQLLIELAEISEDEADRLLSEKSSFEE